MPRRLKNLHVDEVSLVDRAANRRRFLMLKRDGGEIMSGELTQEVLDVLTVPADGEPAAIAKAGVPVAARPAAQAVVRLLKGYAAEFTPAALRGLLDAAGIQVAKAAKDPDDDGDDDEGPEGDDDEDRAAMEGMSEAEKARYRKEHAEARKARREKAREEKARKERAAKAAGGLPEPIKKADGTWDLSGVPVEYAPIVKAAWDAQEIAKAERDLRLTREFVAKAAGYDALPIEPEKFGPVLKVLHEKAPAEAAQVEAVLQGANEAVQKGALYAEAGRSGVSSGGSAWAEIEKAAGELVSKSTGMTKEQAVAKVMEMRPELYARYLRESA